MKPRTQNLGVALAALLALALLPLRTDGGQAQCCNASTSLASLVNDPTNGDEAFFKLPSGPANVMVLMDSSGSMQNLPQCGDAGWGNSPIYTDTATGKQYFFCTSPTIAAPPNPVAPVMATVYGTCQPWTSTITPPFSTTGVTGNADLAWMQNVVPSRTYADPGHPTNSLGLRDDPAWGSGCVGDACLYDPDASYFVNDTAINGTTFVATARRRAHETAATLPRTCIALDGNGSPILDANGATIDLGPACHACLGPGTSGTGVPGFFFYKLTYASSSKGGGSFTYTTFPAANRPPAFLLRGTYLNANPPKFVASRKVVKDLAWIDPAQPSKLDQVRQGLSILCTSCGSFQKATLVVPLGPDKASSFSDPPRPQNFVQARQYIIDAVNAKPGLGFHPASSATPLASALFNVGQYFSAAGFYTAQFGASYEIASFRETSAGTVNAPWVNSSACSICWPCQQNSIVLVTDGAPNNEINFPATIADYDTTGYTAAGNCGTGGTLCFGTDPAPRVASWLHGTQIRPGLQLGRDQMLTVQTISFGVFDPRALQLLQATANMGAGTFQNAQNARQLGDAVMNAVNNGILRQNSFSAASASSLQTVQTALAEAFLTRFRPNETPTWEGHVYRGAFFDEFLNGCDPAKPPAQQPTVRCGPKTVSASFNAVTDPRTGNALCTGVYLIDSDCDEVAEDTETGDFIKKGLGGIPATFPWDAGAVLSTSSNPYYRAADEGAPRTRNIFTWLNGAKVELKTSNVATLLPYLNIDPGWCNALLTQLGIVSADPATECARQVIHFVRGWDVTNGDRDGCWGPGNPKNTLACPSGLNGEERNRANDNRADPKVFWKLGDVFHSSPAVVNPPIDEIRCDTGYEKQCLATLHSPPALAGQTPIDSYSVTTFTPTGSITKQGDAYEKWRVDQGRRKRVVLVGANDGMLHAFDAGDADTSQTPDFAGTWQYTAGTGEELWAFVPPDLLPRLRYLLQSHQYMVDGSVMVRDVWRDFNGDHRKQADEYRTIAIAGERTGGTQYTALDVTDPLNPVFLWSFPEPCKEGSFMAQSWMDFAPRPPPIGPVRIASNVDPRGFEERWIVMINGGYDPAMTRGRAVWMVDVWTGRALWRFSDNDFKAAMGYGEGTSMFPVPAGVALLDIGDLSGSGLDSDGYFDTATWGDLGGNLWVARFQAPGIRGAEVNGEQGEGLITNWFAARAFEERRRTDDLQGTAGRNEFFYMTANAFEPITRTLRTFLGTANRERLMEQAAKCGPDNLLGCCRAGCSPVTSSTSQSYGACNEQSSFSCQNGLYQLPAMTTTCADPVSCAAAPANKYSSQVSLSFTCPGATAVSRSGHVDVDVNGVSSPASYQPVGSFSMSGTFNPLARNRFYGVWSYGKDAAKTFSDVASARTFDRNRFTDVAYAAACTGPSGGTCTLVDTSPSSTSLDLTSGRLTSTCPGGVSKCAADVNDAGWFYEYGDFCPLASCNPPPPWNDEKTGSAANVIFGCTSWGSFRPVGSSGDTNPCSGTTGVPVSYGYLANYVSGTPTPTCGYLSSTGSVYRAGTRVTIAPPSGGMVRVTVSPDGRIAYSTLSFDAGAPPGSKQLSVRSEIGEPVYWMEVPRSLHDCRHVANSGACD